MTKLIAPAIDDGWVRRSDLIDRMNAGLYKRATLICAPAGYGKSTLAAQWLCSLSQCSAWLSLDQDDRELDVFVRYLLASLETVWPDFGSKLHRTLQGTTMPPPRYLAEAFGEAILDRNLPVAIALDDFHLAASPPVMEFFVRCIEIFPEDLHWILLTRERPELPLNLWATRNWINDFTSHDLAFSTDETREFFSQSDSIQMAHEQIDVIQQKTEGWPAGLRLIALAQSDTRSPTLPTASSKAGDLAAMNYFAEQVLQAQPSVIQEFLGITAGLKRFCASLCDKLFDGIASSPSSQELIQELERKNLFIVPLDQHGEWYRYHHLFRQLLWRQRAQLAGGIDPRVVARNAGQWFADNGEVEEAICYFIESGDTKAAAEVVWQNMAETLEVDFSRRTLRRWLAAFPPACLRENTALLIAEAFIKQLSYDWSGIAELLDLAEDRLKQELPEDAACSRDEKLGVVRALQSARHFWQGNFECGLRNAKLALQALPPRQSTARIGAHQYLAGCMTVMGHRSEALQYLKDAEISDAASGSRLVASLLVAQAFIHLLSANFEEALGCASRLEELQDTVGLIDYWLIDIYFVRGFEALERNRLTEAEAEFNKAIPYRYSVNARHYHEILIGLAKVSLARGLYDDAQERLKAARAFALEACDPSSTRISESMEARLAFARGKNFSGEAFKAFPTDAVSFWMEVPTVTYAELILQQARSEAELRRAITFIDEALDTAQSQKTIRQIIILSLLKAMAVESLGDLDAGLRLLETTVEMARPLGLLRTFLERGPRLGPLLERLAGMNPQDDYVHGLLASFRELLENPKTAVEEDASLGLLSDRELEVLHQMSERKSNKEIAVILYISYETVKNHAKSIYRKLGVHSRREAVVRAKALGLDASTWTLSRSLPGQNFPGEK